MAIVISISVLVAVVILAIMMSENLKNKGKEQLIKIVEGTGATDVRVQSLNGGNNVIRFTVRYVDVDGMRQIRHVTQDVGPFGELNGDFYWDKPLEVTRPPLSPTKEQLVSEMDAEIQRLRRALAVSQGDTDVIVKG